MPSTSKHHSTHSTNEIPLSSKHKKSKPIQIPGASRKSKVIIVLPPQIHPPALASSPSHRTAPTPQPVLISSSYPGRHHSRSPSSSGTTPPRVSYSLKASISSSPHQKPRPSFYTAGPSSSSIPHPHARYIPPANDGSGSSPPNPNHFTRATVTGPPMLSGSVSIARTTSVDTYARSTVTRGDMMEDDYYSHPAVRAYEMQKAVEQARWTRHRQMQNAQKKGQSGAQGRW